MSRFVNLKLLEHNLKHGNFLLDEVPSVALALIARIDDLQNWIECLRLEGTDHDDELCALLAAGIEVPE